MARRHLPRRRTDTLPLTLWDQVSSQPRQNYKVYDPEPPREPSDDEQVMKMGETLHLSRLLAHTDEMRKSWGQAREAMLTSNAAQQEANRAGEKAEAIGQSRQWEALVESFAPRRPKIETMQMLAFRQDIPPEELEDRARQLEGGWRAKEFGRQIERLPEEQRGSLSPLAAGLVREDVDGEQFQAIVGAANRDDGSVYKYPAEVRRRANRVLRGAVPEGQLAESLVPEEEDAPLPHGLAMPEVEKPGMAGRFGGIAKGVVDAAGKPGGLVQAAGERIGREIVDTATDPERLATTGRGIANVALGAVQAARGAASIPTAGMAGVFGASQEIAEGAIESVSEGGPFTRAGRAELGEAAGEIGEAAISPARDAANDIRRGLMRAFEGEQQAITPTTRPLIDETLQQGGVSEDARQWISDYVVPFLVPSTAVGFGAGGVGTGALRVGTRIGARAFTEGTINALQEQAAAKQRGDEFGPQQFVTSFVLGGAAAGLLPEVAGAVLKGMRPGGPVDRFLAAKTGRQPLDTLGRAAQEGATPARAIPEPIELADVPQGPDIVYSNLHPERADSIFAGRNTEPIWTTRSADDVKVQEVEGSGMIPFRVREGATPQRSGGIKDAAIYAPEDLEPLAFVPQEKIFEPDVLGRAADVRTTARAQGVPEGDVVRRANELAAFLKTERGGGKLPSGPDPAASASRPSGTPLASADEALQDAQAGARRVPPTGEGGLHPDDINVDLANREIREAAITLREDILQGESRAGAIEDVLRHGQRQFVESDDRGNILRGVRPKEPGQSMDWHDVMSRPDDYIWDDADLRLYFENIYDKIIEPRLRIRQAAGLESDLPPTKVRGERYVPRTVTEIDGKPVQVRGRTQTGAKQSFTKPRSREFAGKDVRVKTEQLPSGQLEAKFPVEGSDVRYLKDIGAEIGLFVRRTSQELADQRYAQVVNRYGQTPAQRIPQELRWNVANAARRLQSARRRFTRVKTLDKGRAIVELERAKNTSRRAQQHLATVQREIKDKTKQAPLGIGRRLREAERRVAEARRLRDDMDEVVGSFQRGGDRQLRSELEVEQAKNALTEAKTARTNAYRRARTAKPGEAMLQERFAAGRIFPEDIAQTAERQLHAPGALTALDVTVGTANTVLKPLWAAIDLSFTALQTLPGLMINPAGTLDAWRVAATSAIRPGVYDGFVARHIDTVNEIIDAGVPWYKTEVSFEEFMGQPLPKPLAKARNVAMRTVLRPFDIANDVWARAINVQTVHMWRQGTAMIDELGEDTFLKLIQRNVGLGNPRGANAREGLAAALSHGTGRLTTREMAQAGPGALAFNRIMPFAGRYWAAWGHLIADAATQGGMRGNMSRRLIAGWLASGVGLYSAAAMATGQEPRLDPTEPSFLTLEVPFGMKTGVGGPLQQILALSGRIANDPEHGHEILTKWARGKSSPIVSMATDLFERQTYTGKPINSREDALKYVLARTIPFASTFAMQDVSTALLDGDLDEVVEALKAIPYEVPGLRAFPVSPSEIILEEARNVIAEMPAERRRLLGVPEDLGKIEWADLPPEVKEEARIREPEAAAAAHESLAEQAATGDGDAQRILLGREIAERHAEQMRELADQFEAGNVTAEDYREGVGNLDLMLRGQRDLIAAEHGFDLQDRPDKPGVLQDLHDYFAIFDRFPNADVDPDQKEALFSTIEGFRAGLSTEREQVLDDNMHLKTKDIRPYQELRRVRERLQTTGYWNTRETVWESFRQSIPDLPETAEEFIEQQKQEFLAATGDEALAEILANQHPLLKKYEELASLERRRWLYDHPDMLPVLNKWGYREYAQADLPILGMYEMQQQQQGQLAGVP